MTLTDKQLAEFGAEFLPTNKYGVMSGFQVTEENLLGTGEHVAAAMISAAYFLHLAETELKKLGLRLDVTNYINGDYRAQIFRGNEELITAHFDENKFRAFWSAVYVAVKGGE